MIELRPAACPCHQEQQLFCKGMSPLQTSSNAETGSANFDDLRVAIIHYWFVGLGGGERVVDALAEMFPQADIFTLLLNPSSLSPTLRSRKITSSFLQRVPGAKRYYQKLLPLFPLAIENLPVDDYDLVISSESGPAKGVLTRPGVCHICYCHTPMRYVWDMYRSYQTGVPGGKLGRALYSIIAHYVRQWDYATSARVDYFVANSRNVAARIRKYYRREAEVIHPPVEMDSYSLSVDRGHQDFYLVVSRLVPYKRIDLAIAACNELRRPLVVIGDGEARAALQRMAGPSVRFLGFQPDEVVREHYQRCRALLFPGEEDMGLTPIEAQASGRPVIAFGRGGALETVQGFFSGDATCVESYTGVFFKEQSANSLLEAIRTFESVESRFCPTYIRSQVERFDTSRFRTEMGAFIARKWADFHRFSPS